MAKAGQSPLLTPFGPWKESGIAFQGACLARDAALDLAARSGRAESEDADEGALVNGVFAQKWLLRVTGLWGLDVASLPRASPAVNLDATSKREILHDLIFCSLGLDQKKGQDELKKVDKAGQDIETGSSEGMDGEKVANPTSKHAAVADAAPKENPEDTPPDSPFSYDARARALIFAVSKRLFPGEGEGNPADKDYEKNDPSTATLLSMPLHSDLLTAEKSFAQALYFLVQEGERHAQEAKSQGEQGQTRMQSAGQDAVSKSSRNKTWGLAAAGGALIGGLAIGITGGLAAPVVAPMIAGATGLTFFATAGGAALVGSLFGIGGAGLAGYRTHRRMLGITDFEFIQMTKDPTLPPIPSLNVMIFISGYLLDSDDEVITPWQSTVDKLPMQDTYALAFERPIMKEYGARVRSFIRDQAVKFAGQEALKLTVLSAVIGAVSLPLTLYNTATLLIDSEYSRAKSKAEKAGIILAETLEQRVQGTRPVTLVGWGMGSVVIWAALEIMAKKMEKGQDDIVGILENVILIGSPLTSDPVKWTALKKIVARRFVNVYSHEDWVLAIVARVTSLSAAVAGLRPIDSTGVENIDVSKIVKGHMEYHSKLSLILDEVGLDQ